MASISESEIDLTSHHCGATDCPMCAAQPLPCFQPNCNGLVHVEFKGPNEKLSLCTVFEKCDKCSNTSRLYHERAFCPDKWQLHYIRRRDLQEEDLQRREQEAIRRTEKDRCINASTEEEFIEYLVNSAESLDELEYVLLVCMSLQDPEFMWEWPVSRCRSERFERRNSLPWIPKLFFARDPERLFMMFQAALSQSPVDLKKRSAALGLYGYFSKCEPAVWRRTPEIYGRAMLFGSYYRRLVRMLNLVECTDWKRTRWEIDNAWVAKDFDLARDLIQHAVHEKLAETNELLAVRMLLEYRMVVGPQLDQHSARGVLGPNAWWGDERPIDDEDDPDDLIYANSPYSTEQRDLTLDALCLARPMFDLGAGADGHPFEFLWGLLNFSLRSLESGQSHELLKQLDSFESGFDQIDGVAKSYLIGLRAQLLEMAGEDIASARSYESLQELPNPIPCYRTTMLARNKAALMFMKASRPDEAIRVLECACLEDPDMALIWENLAKAYLMSGEVKKAQEVARTAASIRENRGVCPEINFLLNLPDTVTEAEVDQSVAAWKHFPMLTVLSQKEWRFAVQNSIHAQKDARMRIEHIGCAALFFSKAVELELLEAIFRPWREETSKGERASALLQKEDPIMSRFLLGGVNPALGEMIKAMHKSTESSLSVMQSLARFIRKRNGQLLNPIVLQELEIVRNTGNSKRHAELDAALASTAEQRAKKCIAQIHPAVFAIRS